MITTDHIDPEQQARVDHTQKELVIKGRALEISSISRWAHDEGLYEIENKLKQIASDLVDYSETI